MALAMPPDGKVISLDISDKDIAVGRPFWKAAGVEHKIEVRIAPAGESLRKLSSLDSQVSCNFDVCASKQVSNSVVMSQKFDCTHCFRQQLLVNQ